MGMLGTAVHLELFDHGKTQRTFWQHAFDRFFQSTCGVLGLHVFEIGAGDAARVTRVTVVHLVLGFVACDANFGSVDDDYVVAGIDVGRINGFVLAA